MSEPVTAYAAFDEDGLIMATIRRTAETAEIVAETLWEVPWHELKQGGMRIGRVEIREIKE